MLGLNGRRILDGLVQRHSVERILKMLTWHMRDKLEPIARTRDSQFYGYHDNMKSRIGHKRATLATAHKLLRVIYAILRDDHPYRDRNWSGRSRNTMETDGCD